MNTKTKKIAFFMVLTLLVASALTTFIYFRFQSQRMANRETSPPLRAIDPGPLTRAQSPSVTAIGASQPRRQKPPLQDPKAREALVYVGADWEATAYWNAAINNPNLPDEERADLIEDLNENGFTNNRRPGIEDLPLIEMRIALIEMLAPNAMDQVNADAFQEAYKDLLNMRSRLTGQPAGPIPRLPPR